MTTLQQSPLDTVLAAERALDMFVKQMAKNYSYQCLSVFAPFKMTASEQWMHQRLFEQLEAAKDHHRRMSTVKYKNELCQTKPQ